MMDETFRSLLLSPLRGLIIFRTEPTAYQAAEKLFRRDENDHRG